MEYINAFLQFMKVLLLAPIALPWMWVAVAVASLIAMGFVLAYVFSAAHVHWAKDWRKLTVTTTRVRVAWACGWAFSASIILLWASSLTYLNRILSFRAALPYLVAAAATIAIASVLRSKVRSKVRTVQQLVQGGRA